ncbi:MAG: hypothetical protein ACYC6Q_05240 [Syntrophales bacterium]
MKAEGRKTAAIFPANFLEVLRADKAAPGCQDPYFLLSVSTDSDIVINPAVETLIKSQLIRRTLEAGADI